MRNLHLHLLWFLLVPYHGSSYLSRVDSPHQHRGHPPIDCAMAVSLIVASLALPCPTQHAALARGVFRTALRLDERSARRHCGVARHGRKASDRSNWSRIVLCLRYVLELRLARCLRTPWASQTLAFTFSASASMAFYRAKGLLEWYDAHLTPTLTAEV